MQLRSRTTNERKSSLGTAPELASGFEFEETEDGEGEDGDDFIPEQRWFHQVESIMSIHSKQVADMNKQNADMTIKIVGAMLLLVLFIVGFVVVMTKR